MKINVICTVHADEIDQAEANLENGENANDMRDAVAPGNLQHELLDQEAADHQENSNQHEDVFTEYDIGTDLGINAGSSTSEENIRNRVSDIEYRSLVRALNREQREIFHHILKIAKTTCDQQFIFISGGAGVGKTRLTLTLYQALTRHYNSTAGDDTEQKSVMMVAPTGKAAYLIKGTTIHSAFGIPCKLQPRVLLQKFESERTKYIQDKPLKF